MFLFFLESTHENVGPMNYIPFHKFLIQVYVRGRIHNSGKMQVNSRAIYFINSLNPQHAVMVQVGSCSTTPHNPDLSDQMRCNWLLNFILQAHYALDYSLS